MAGSGGMMRGEDRATLLPGIVPDLRPDLLLRAAVHRRSDVLCDVRLLANAALTPPAEPDLLWAGGGLWGPFWKGHPFGGPSLFNHIRLTEPQITRELASWLSRSPGNGIDRSGCFLIALMGEPGAFEADWSDFIRSSRITVEAEKDPASIGRKRPRKESRRNGALDLFFTLAGPDGERRHVVVEAKCDAAVGKGQLSTYRNRTRQLPGTRYVFLAPARAPELGRNKDWRFCTWRGLLARWESRLAASGDDDRVFSLFRSELFRRFS
ncbi:hypothetical protein D8I30_10735 [Brevundimonas naejangsanensis]|uniref:PD-(D/E)XK nuclease family protein n=2 Tax=Brevundimonas naejangsanensis TaxID=588932 RepID=A0A494RNH6_9CAUL|nr:hypothetical protein D8I30_10735 [Brevundimonas naejangsanensis]